MDSEDTPQVEKKEMQLTWEQELWGFIKVVVVSLLIVLPIRAFIVQPFIVRGDSMVPNYSEGEYLIIDEASYYLRSPDRGEVIVFRYPINPRQFFIKRIIGLPGETVEIVSGKVMIYNEEHPEGIALSEEYLPSGTPTNQDTKITLDEKEYFVMGDNRPASHDSRNWGKLDERFIVGRAWLRLWPAARAQVLNDGENQ